MYIVYFIIPNSRYPKCVSCIIINYANNSLSVDATKETDRLGRLVNHSKNHYNAVSKLIPVHGRPHLVLMASRDIGISEEVLYDYGDHSKNSIQAHPWLEK